MRNLFRVRLSYLLLIRRKTNNVGTIPVSYQLLMCAIHVSALSLCAQSATAAILRWF
jgi:hypothetical protein